MKLHYVAAVAMLPLTVAACSSHGDPWHPKKNPHPIKRYEVIATADAPGPWDSVKGYVFFDVVNTTCVPQESFTGGQNVPNVAYDFEMTRISNNTWKGYFYRDALQDDDYFGQGVCHWDVTGVTPSFTVHNEEFSAAMRVKEGRQLDWSMYFKKVDFSNYSLKGDGALQSSAETPEVIQHPEAFFPITVNIKEIAP